MIWLLVVLLAVAALAPLADVLRQGGAARGAKDLAVALHRGQLAELDRDLAEGRIMPAEHATAVLEVQRRLLAAAGETEPAAAVRSRAPLAVVLVLVPLAAFALYAVGGSPGLPSVPKEQVRALVQRDAEEAALIGQLRERLAAMDPASERARQGYVLLGNVEEARGHDAAAAAAWGVALQSQFDATLAARAAEAASRAEGGVSEASAALFRRALDAAPADAPWRGVAEQRLRQARLP